VNSQNFACTEFSEVGAIAWFAEDRPLTTGTPAHRPRVAFSLRGDNARPSFLRRTGRL
jgi:hypothetical protein